jgi:hypothetical protein
MKERKLREIQFYIVSLLNSMTFQGFAEYCLEIKDISGLFRISFFFKVIPGIPGAVQTLLQGREKSTSAIGLLGLDTRAVLYTTMHPKISTFNNHFKGHCDSRYLCMLFDC